jgi:hypothetical protein
LAASLASWRRSEDCQGTAASIAEIPNQVLNGHHLASMKRTRFSSPASSTRSRAAHAETDGHGRPRRGGADGRRDSASGSGEVCSGDVGDVPIERGASAVEAHRRSRSALLPRWDTKPAAHQEDLPTSGTDTQNVFLCRSLRMHASRSPRRTCAELRRLAAHIGVWDRKLRGPAAPARRPGDARHARPARCRPR